MDPETFRKEIERELKRLSPQQRQRFAWRCAVRALPFLGGRGHFRFWKEAKRQKHLQAVLYVLDATYALNDDAYDAYVDDVAAYDAYVAAYAAAYDAYDAYVDDARAAAYAADGAACAARAAAADGADVAARAARAAAADGIDLRSTILEDLRASKPTASIGIYGAQWDAFQTALQAEGCAYWGELYKSIFENHFELDEEALKRRLSVPLEIRDQGAAAVARHLEALKIQGAEKLNEARIVILGDKGSGKTSLARKLIDPDAEMPTDAESTAGVDVMHWTPDFPKKFHAHIWDFAGHTVTHAVHKFFLSERCLYILVYDGRSEVRNRLNYWLDHMKNYGGESQAMILVNERDGHAVEIAINALRKRYSIPNYSSFSIKDGKEELLSFRKAVADYLGRNPSWDQTIPKNSFRVKEKLRERFSDSEGNEHISMADFKAIARSCDVVAEDDIKQLLKDLHALGVSLWYPKMESFDKLVLNPEWISQGVYRIINWMNEQREHALALEEFSRAFEEQAYAKRYPKKTHEYLFHLMQHYKLAYATTGERKSLICPSVLPIDEPEELPDFPKEGGQSLLLRYTATRALPPDTISRFIVRHNQEIKEEGRNRVPLLWRKGVVLKRSNGDAIALVQFQEEDRQIQVSVKGDDKTEYIAELRGTLNKIFDSYKSKRPDLKYWIERLKPPAEKIPEETEEMWVEEKVLKTYYSQNKDLLYTGTGDTVPTQTVIKQYNILGISLNKILGVGNRVDRQTFVKVMPKDLGNENSKLNKFIGGITRRVAERILGWCKNLNPFSN